MEGRRIERRKKLNGIKTQMNPYRENERCVLIQNVRTVLIGDWIFLKNDYVSFLYGKVNENP